MASYPLFPLPVVLFPGALLPLHIFEHRYRVMVADCAQGNQRFVLLPPGEEDGAAPLPGSVGTVAKIRVVQPLPDGRSNIAVSGEERVTLTALTPSDRPYLVGTVAPLADVEETQLAAPADLARLLALGERYVAALSTIADTEPDAEFVTDPGALSFQIASLTEWDYPTKHHFLGLRSSYERVQRLLAALPPLIADVESRAAVHRRATTNGKGRHHG